MAGRELYAPRTARHRRTWSVAAVVLAAFFLLVGPLIGLYPAILLGLMDATGKATSWVGDFYQLVVFFGLSAVLLMAWVILFERRPLSTIGFNGQGLMRFARGYGVGLAFLLATIGIIAIAGGYRIEGGGAFAAAAVPAAFLPIVALLIGFIIQGSTEEIVFRGWLMQLIASRHGLIIALIVNAVLFGLAHAGNTEPTKELALGVVNIVLFGTFIGLYAAREGSLWGVCGWHAAWNWLLGLGFGLEVSGHVLDVTPLFVDLTTTEGAPWWLTGATFGPEASVVTTVILLGASVWVVMRGPFPRHAAPEPVVEPDTPAIP
ncbi:MAG: CPBP family intramembrane metalloprotease [Alphaproteobacteria bacterium]|nr:CPBP family intramembrane metalloprotease [Alphaproteobacteria bacterium]MBU2380068.1 CPBP family intramembrane metalloprotease [Alphaproteobacteria bacterium]